MLEAEIADRPLTDDVTAATMLLDQLATTADDMTLTSTVGGTGTTGTTRGIA